MSPPRQPEGLRCGTCQFDPKPCPQCQLEGSRYGTPAGLRGITRYKSGNSILELGEQPCGKSGPYRVYRYWGRRNDGPWLDLEQYGNRFPTDWLRPDMGYIPLEDDTINLGSITPGYHVAKIPRGIFGDASKIVEEAAEFQDAVEQDCKVMALVELSDLMGATQAYLDNVFPGITIDDLCMMAAITGRAFDTGQRISRQ